MVDLTTYTPPGVYVDDISQDIVVPLSPGIPENLLCIVAPALGYQSVTENLSVFSALSTPLRHPFVIDDSSLILRTVTGTLLTEDTDYSVDTDTATNGDVYTTITRLPVNPVTASPGGVVDGGLVQASYHFTDKNYFSPQRFSEYSTLASVYGEALSAEVGAVDPIVSPLSLAAKIAFENGAGDVIAVPVNHNTSSWLDDYQSAYDLLITDHRVSVLVVVFPDSEINTAAGGTGSSGLTAHMTALRLHCDAAAANGFGREAMSGGGSMYDETVPYEEVATTIQNKRVMLVYPTKYNLYNAKSAQNIEVGGGYAAAALGGRLVLNPVEQSLTRQPVKSFDSIPASIQQKMTLAFKNHLSSNGVCVIETDRLNRMVVRHGVTTDMRALNSRELSLVRISDVLAQNIQVGLDSSGLIGQPIDAEMTMKVKGALLGLLEQAVSNNVIVAYINVLVRQQVLPNGDPSVIECQFAYKPAVPLNYITVQFSLNLTDGTVVDTTLATP
jgi:hypothetical protein